MKFRLEIECDTFEDQIEPDGEVAAIIGALSNRIGKARDKKMSGVLRDSNGNEVGVYGYTERICRCELCESSPYKKWLMKFTMQTHNKNDVKKPY